MHKILNTIGSVCGIQDIIEIFQHKQQRQAIHFWTNFVGISTFPDCDCVDSNINIFQKWLQKDLIPNPICSGLTSSLLTIMFRNQAILTFWLLLCIRGFHFKWSL